MKIWADNSQNISEFAQAIWADTVIHKKKATPLIVNVFMMKNKETLFS